MTSWILHDPPGLDLTNASSSKRLQPSDLSEDVVSLEVEVHARATLLDSLHETVNLRAGKIRVRSFVLWRPAQGGAPELGRRFVTLGIGVDSDGT